MRKEREDGNHLAEHACRHNDQYLYLRAGTSAARAGTAGRDCQDSKRAAIHLFAKTGVWVEQERTCEQYGKELLPSTLGLVCEQCLEEGFH